MNAAAKVLAEGSLFRGGVTTVNWSKQTFWMALFLAAVLFSALAVIYIENTQRHLFSELQSLRHSGDELRVERSQLLLEQSTWGAPARVQGLAQQRLNMRVPKSQEIKIITQVSHQDMVKSASA